MCGLINIRNGDEQCCTHEVSPVRTDAANKRTTVLTKTKQNPNYYGMLIQTHYVSTDQFENLKYYA